MKKVVIFAKGILKKMQIINVCESWETMYS